MAHSVGHYELHEELGSGALGVTYRARDTRTGTDVALKILRPSLTQDDVEAAARLRREARVASELDHPNIAQVIEQGEAAGAMYVAATFAEGETLRARLQREDRLSEAETHGIAVCVAHALNAADALRVVHRNLKPENILVSEDGQLRVCDFGLTQALDTVTPTRFVAFIATPAYAAPELEKRRGDIRSDLYSLGAIMFEALTGRVPFAGDSVAAPVRKDPADGAGVALSQASRSLAPIVQRLLKTDPRDRYADPEQLLRALQAVGRLASSVVASSVVPDVAAAPPPTAAAASRLVDSAEDGDQPSRRGRAAARQRGLGRWMSRLAGGGRTVDTRKLLTERARTVLENEVLTEAEERAFLEFAASLGVESLDDYPDIQHRLVIARANDGRLPVLESGGAQFNAKPGEAVHLQARCSLLQDATAGASRGSGFSFPVVKGGRYRASSDQLQALGRQMAVADVGILHVTSQCVVFSGRTETRESLYSRLVFLRVYSDGLGISVSNRQNISTYRLLDTSGEVVAAVINAAAQRIP